MLEWLHSSAHVSPLSLSKLDSGAFIQGVSGLPKWMEQHFKILLHAIFRSPFISQLKNEISNWLLHCFPTYL
jgi:hypothetical protein